MSVRYIVETEEGKEKNVINLLQDCPWCLCEVQDGKIITDEEGVKALHDITTETDEFGYDIMPINHELENTKLIKRILKSE